MSMSPARFRGLAATLVVVNAAGLIWIQHSLAHATTPHTRLLTALSGRDVDAGALVHWDCHPNGDFRRPAWTMTAATGPPLEDDGRQPSSAFSVLDVSIVALRICDDDGKRPARVSPEQVAQWVQFANRVFQPAAIRFRFDRTSDFSTIRNTVINNMTGTSDANWNRAKALGHEIAAKYPDKLVLFFRHGPGASATGGGFSWIDYNYVVMPGFDDARHCGHAHIDALAHEIGHYLGLPHTFPQPFDTIEQAAAYLKLHGGRPDALDGDGLSDTPPDPAIRATECDSTRRLTINGMTFTLPRRNIMSYYDERDSLSPQQIRRVRWFLAFRQAHHMALPVNAGARQPVEAESAKIEAFGVETVVQPMTGFGSGTWSGGKQVFCHTRDRGRVALVFAIEHAGRYRLGLYATLAPDYGRVRIELDGRRLGTRHDGYAPGVLESGRIELGTIALSAGSHRMTFVVDGKNSASTGFKLGIDCIDVIPGG